MDTHSLKVIELSGTPRERGRIHGEELREHIRAVLEITKSGIEKNLSIDPAHYIRDFLAYSNFESGIQQYAPDILEEVEGLAEGAAIDTDTARYLQLTDEDWVFRQKVYPELSNAGDNCTAFALKNSSGVLTRQNMDINYVDGYQVLFHIRYPDRELESFVYSIAGLIALNGMNSAPLGICCNTLMELYSTQFGLPVQFIVRKVLECTSFDSAREFLRKITHASGQNYIIATAESFGSFECSANEVTEFIPYPNSPAVCHSNSPLASRDIDPDAMARFKSQAGLDENFKARYESIWRRLGDAGRDHTIEDAKAALSAHDDRANPVSRTFDPESGEKFLGYTAGSMIYQLDRKNPVLHLASGPPCQTEYRKFRFSDLWLMQ